MIPRTVQELAREDVEIRPIPGYEGYYCDEDGIVYTIRTPRSSNASMHPRLAHIVQAPNGVGVRGKNRIYKREILSRTFPERETNG